MTSQQGQAFEDLRNTVNECSRIVRHRWRLALVGLAIVGSAAFWGSQYLPREYAAATIFERRDDVVLQNLVQTNSPYSFQRLKSTLTLDMLGSRALARAAVRAGLLPAETFTSNGALTESERAALDGALGQRELRPAVRLIHSSPNLDTIQVSCTANDPVAAREFVIALRDHYIADTRERIRDILNSTRAFFASEVARVQEELARTAGGLRQGFEDFPGLDPTDLAAVGNRLETLRLQRNDMLQRKAELEAQITAREQFLVSAPSLYIRPAPDLMGPPAPTPPPSSPVVEQAIEGVRRQIVELVTGKRMTMEHPDVKRLLGRLEALEELRESLASSAADAPTGLPPVAPDPQAESGRREWSAQRMRIELELDALRRQLAVTKEQFAEIDGRVERFANLYNQLLSEGEELRALRERQAAGTNELSIWQSHLAQLDRVLAAESGDRGTQFALIEEPKDESRPTKPRVASVFLVCSGLGLAVAALLVGLAELFDRSFRSVGQVTRALGVPVLECISTVLTPRERRRALLARAVWTPTLAVLLGLLAASAGLAYTSLVRPTLHARAMQKMDRMLGATDAAAAWDANGEGRVVGGGSEGTANGASHQPAAGAPGTENWERGTENTAQGPADTELSLLERNSDGTAVRARGAS